MLRSLLDDFRYGRMVRPVLIAGVFTQTVMPSFTVILLLSKPCVANLFLRSALQDCPARGWIPQLEASFWAKLVTSLSDSFVHAYTFGQAVIAIGIVFFASVEILRDHMTKYVHNTLHILLSLKQAR